MVLQREQLLRMEVLHEHPVVQFYSDLIQYRSVLLEYRLKVGRVVYLLLVRDILQLVAYRSLQRQCEVCVRGSRNSSYTVFKTVVYL